VFALGLPTQVSPPPKPRRPSMMKLVGTGPPRVWATALGAPVDSENTPNLSPAANKSLDRFVTALHTFVTACAILSTFFW